MWNLHRRQKPIGDQNVRAQTTRNRVNGGAWKQAAQSVSGQQIVFRVLAGAPDGKMWGELQLSCSLNDQTLHDALKALRHHDVLLEESGRWHYTVELLRR